MNGNGRTIEQLREAAERLEAAAGETLMPGWDPAHDDERRQGIRAAARAVLADGLTFDEGTKVRMEHLGMLVRYIADMLE